VPELGPGGVSIEATTVAANTSVARGPSQGLSINKVERGSQLVLTARPGH
jgi:hypothetical protein